jgi:hypothetical protein
METPTGPGQMAQLPPKPIVARPSSTMTGTSLRPPDHFSISSSREGSETTLT